MGLFDRLGSYARKIWDWAKGRIEPIASALGIAREAEVETEPVELWREYRKVIRLEDVSATIAGLDFEQYIPRGLYTESEIPWNRPFAYEVTISGRDLATGRFARTARMMTFSRELSIGEIMEEATSRFGATGAYPQMDVTHLSVTGAQVRAGDVF
jgi:hypothetical protein